MRTAARLRTAALVAAVAVVASACGGAGAEGEDAASTASETESSSAATVAALPDGVAAAPAAPHAPAPAPAIETELPALQPVEVPATVDVHRPDLVIRTEDVASSKLYEALAVQGIEASSAAHEFTATLTTFEGEMREVTILAVDHSTFRPLTPEITANAPGVWQRLSEGDILVRHDIAHELHIPLGGDVDLSSTEAQLTARVGAFASNGAPPLADVIVPWELGSRLGTGEVNTLLVAVREDASESAIGDRVEEILGEAEVEVREAPVEQKAAQIVGSSGRRNFEPFTYTDLGDGQIVIDPAWTRKWIQRIEIPGLGVTRCHRLMVPQLFAALEEIQAKGLYGHFKPEQFAGCWVPRHIDWNPNKPLSMHAWGLAIDLNSHDNWLGEEPQMDMRIVEIFEKWGFEWGGRWRRPDGMHFELDRVIEIR